MPENTITKDQWLRIAEELKGYFPCVQFKYQSTVITIARVRDGESKTVLAVYFDGEMRSGWGMETSEIYNPITRMFWFEKKKRLYPPKRAAQIEKEFGKRRAKDYFPKLYDSVSYLMPYFTSSNSLIRQFKKVDGLMWLPKNEAN